MKKYESDCCDCGLPCKGGSCPYYSMPHCYCDKCGEEDELYEYGDSQLCGTCLLESVPKVNEYDNCRPENA